MAGYYGYSMSNNARQAYKDGEQPLSKWTKAEILSELPEAKVAVCKKLTFKELRELFLKQSSWHHTSMYYNKTNFYQIDREYIDSLNIEDLQKEVSSIISLREPKKSKAVEVKKPLYVTALVKWTQWEGRFRNYRSLKEYKEVIHFMSDQSMVTTEQGGKKRLSSLIIVYKIEQKTKFADKQVLLKKYENKKIK